MNDDYIKRKEALSAIKQMSEEHYPYKTIFRAIRILHHVPTADVRENVKGKWLKKKGSLWTLATCSVCGELSVEGDKPFCPNCGAYMRGES